MSNESFYMHSRYNEFLEFLKGVESDAKRNPNALNLAFDAWFNSNNNDFEELKRDLNRLHKERDSFQQQARVLAAEVERLNELLAYGSAIGERGEACMSIDGGNL